MMFSTIERNDIVSEANSAPSVHNTQPTRWLFKDSEIHLYIDEARILKVGDPSRQDAGISCGAALEGTLIALSKRRMIAEEVVNLWESNGAPKYQELTQVAKILYAQKEESVQDELSEYVPKRYTWRGMFESSPDHAISELANWGHTHANVTIVTAREEVKFLARLNDAMSLRFFKNKPYRDELLSYMRFKKSHPLWSQDGLNLDAMQLSDLEGMAASIALKDPFFKGLDILGIAGHLITERAKTESASGILFFTSPKGRSPLDTGRELYRKWLELTRLGFVAWPMAVLADAPDSAAQCAERFHLPKDHKLINVFRVGWPMDGYAPIPARLPLDTLILEKL